jgi:hypothetical protein
MGLISTILISCKNSECPTRSVPIRLPCPSQAKRSSRPLGQPIFAFHVNLACPSCGSIASYTTGDCHFEDIEKDLLHRDRTHKVVLSALRPCGEQNCETRIEILTLAASELTIAEVYPIIRTWFFLHLQFCPSEWYKIFRLYANRLLSRACERSTATPALWSGVDFLF